MTVVWVWPPTPRYRIGVRQDGSRECRMWVRDRRLLGVAASPIVPGGCPQEAPPQGGQASVGVWMRGRLLGVAVPTSTPHRGYRVAPGRREKGVWFCGGLVGVAASPIVPGGCPQEAPLQGGQASVGVWMRGRLLGVAAPVSLPTMGTGLPRHDGRKVCGFVAGWWG